MILARKKQSQFKLVLSEAEWSQYKERIQNKGHRIQKAVFGPLFSVISASTDSSLGTPYGGMPSDGIPRTAYYKRYCPGPSGLAMAFLAI